MHDTDLQHAFVYIHVRRHRKVSITIFIRHALGIVKLTNDTSQAFIRANIFRKYTNDMEVAQGVRRLSHSITILLRDVQVCRVWFQWYAIDRSPGN